jgi:large subunit ribosomal protein L13
MKTQISSQQNIKHAWHLIDAKDQVLGRVATQAAGLLRGKSKVTFDYALDHGDFVVVINIDKIRVTGNKLQDKMYYRHTGYMGNLKQIDLNTVLTRNPERVVLAAIKGMLPINRLGAKLLKRVRLVKGEQHSYPVAS